MRYQCVNEPETISLHDAEIQKFEYQGQGQPAALTMELTGAVVKAENSQNEYYTDKYVDLMQIQFRNAVLETVLLEGHKYYDANDKLLEQVPDTEVEPERYAELFRKFVHAYIFYGGNPDGEEKLYQMIIDVEEDSYVVSLRYEKLVVRWERFLNKVQTI